MKNTSQGKNKDIHRNLQNIVNRSIRYLSKRTNSTTMKKSTGTEVLIQTEN